MIRIRPLAVLFALGLAATPAWADGMLVPTDPNLGLRCKCIVNSHFVDIKVRGMATQVHVLQEFENRSRTTLQLQYVLPVQPGAVMQDVIFGIDGKQVEMHLTGPAEAKALLEDLARVKKDPAFLEFEGCGLYRSDKITLEPNRPMTVAFAYNGACRLFDDLIEIDHPMGTDKFSDKPVGDVRLSLDVQTPLAIATLYSPSYDLTCAHKDDDPSRVLATWKGLDITPDRDMRLFVRTARDLLGAAMFTDQPDAQEDGYFTLLAAPMFGTHKPLPKDVVVAVDRGGAQGGHRIEHIRTALEHVLRNLNKDDRFSVVLYNDVPEAMPTDILPATRARIESAMEWMVRAEPGGEGTNLDGAITRALYIMSVRQQQDANEARIRIKQAVKTHGGRDRTELPPPRPQYLLLLSSSLPAAGKIDEPNILNRARMNNTIGARIYTLGVGYNANVRILDRLAADNHGRSDYVRDNDSIEDKVAEMYDRIRNPLLATLRLDVPGLHFTDRFPRELGDLFEGDQIFVTGRYDANDAQWLYSCTCGECGPSCSICQAPPAPAAVTACPKCLAAMTAAHARGQGATPASGPAPTMCADCMKMITLADQQPLCPACRAALLEQIAQCPACAAAAPASHAPIVGASTRPAENCAACHAVIPAKNRPGPCCATQPSEAHLPASGPRMVNLCTTAPATQPTCQCRNKPRQCLNCLQTVYCRCQPKFIIHAYDEGGEVAYEFPLVQVEPGQSSGAAFIQRLWNMRRVAFLLGQIQLNERGKEVCEEIILRSRDYGIITPYTSFMTDGNWPLHDARELRKGADRATEALWPYTGPQGQIGAANRLQLARNKLSMPTTCPGRDPNAPPDSFFIEGSFSQVMYEQPHVEITVGVRQAGDEFIYQRDTLWIAASAADLDPFVDADKIKAIRLFGEEYFGLVHGNTAEENQVLATQQPGEELLLRLRGQAYRIR